MSPDYSYADQLAADDTPPRSEPRTCWCGHVKAHHADWAEGLFCMNRDCGCRHYSRAGQPVEAEAAHPTAASTDALRAALDNLLRHHNLGQPHLEEPGPRSNYQCEFAAAAVAALAATPPSEPKPDGWHTYHICGGLLREVAFVEGQMYCAVCDNWFPPSAHPATEGLDVELIDAVGDILTSDSDNADDHLHWEHLHRLYAERRARLSSPEGQK